MTFYVNQTRARGAAIYVRNDVEVVVLNSLFVGNTATRSSGGSGGSGGVIALEGEAVAVFTNCTMAENDVTFDGGGIAAYETSQVTLQNSVLYGNSDGNNDGELSAPQIFLDGELRLLDDPITIDTGVGSAPIVDMGAFEYGIFADGFEIGDTSGWSSTVP